MSKSTFVYVTFIRTTPERLWTALTTPEFIKQYWMGVNCECAWKRGSRWVRSRYSANTSGSVDPLSTTTISKSG